MKVTTKKSLVYSVFKILLRCLLYLTIGITMYLILALAGTLIPMNTSVDQQEKDITIFVTSNGFHTDIVLPVQNRRDKCFRLLTMPPFAEKYAQYQYISYGWGDKDFYMQSYGGGFPSAGTILDALFLPSETLMHINLYRNPLQANEYVKELKISTAQYEALVDGIDRSFLQNNTQYSFLNQPGYGKNDYFFEASGKYHLFNTCNTWTGNILCQAGLPTSFWTPLANSVFFYLPE